jgi:hypothetical protein
MLLSAGAWAQSTGGGSVVVGKDSLGRNIILQVIPLKFMDARLAAALFGGVTVDAGTGVGRLGTSGSDPDRGYSRRGGDSRDRTSNRSQGYGGYSEAGRSYDSYPGYQSPYAAR